MTIAVEVNQQYKVVYAFWNTLFYFVTSIDSLMLVEEGFKVVSTDASDKMLKYALKERWRRRKEPNFDFWGQFKP